jgi:hypothetical protein
MRALLAEGSHLAGFSCVIDSVLAHFSRGSWSLVCSWTAIAVREIIARALLKAVFEVMIMSECQNALKCIGYHDHLLTTFTATRLLLATNF